MPRRQVFRDPLTGRFVSAADIGTMDVLQETYKDGEQVQSVILRGGVPIETSDIETFATWSVTETERTVQWHDDGNAMDLVALQDAGYPDDAKAYRILYQVPDNPDYPRGYMSSEWLRPAQWPPDLSYGTDRGASGIERIYFDVTS